MTFAVKKRLTSLRETDLVKKKRKTEQNLFNEHSKKSKLSSGKSLPKVKVLSAQKLLTTLFFDAY